MPNTTDTPITERHTPGPWALDFGTDGAVIHNDVTIAQINEDAVSWQANAHLIAAAPELLAACIEFVQHIETLPTDTEKCRILKMSLNNRAGDMILKAIAKATQK